MGLVACTHAYQVVGFYYAGQAAKASGAIHVRQPVHVGLTALRLVRHAGPTDRHDDGAHEPRLLAEVLGPNVLEVAAHERLLGLRERGPPRGVRPFAARGAPRVRVGFIFVVLAVSVLHVAAAQRSTRADCQSAAATEDACIDVGEVRDLKEGYARAVCPQEGERIALVRKDNKLYALLASVRTSGARLEGRVKDGCLTCPWHGWQYKVEDGRSPPPIEQLSTYRLRLKNGRVLVDPRVLPRARRADPVSRAVWREPCLRRLTRSSS